jgi:hypothetical protein
MSAPAAMRRRVALVGVLAVLFQALLFGWHHHPLALGSHAAPAVHAAGLTLSPAIDEDGCDICAALHHVSAAAGEFISLAPPAEAASAAVLPDLGAAERACARAFQARAPPRA